MSSDCADTSSTGAGCSGSTSSSTATFNVSSDCADTSSTGAGCSGSVSFVPVVLFGCVGISADWSGWTVSGSFTS